MKIPILASSVEGISYNLSSQEAINYYFEKAPQGELYQGAMLPLHGASSFTTSATVAAGRKALFDPDSNLLYAVIGNKLYEYQSDTTETSRGTLNTSSGRVQMALNPFSGEILIVDGTNGYIYDIGTTTLSVISDTDYPDTATTCDYIDGRFLVNDPNNPGRFWWSDANDGTSWDSASYSTAQSVKGALSQILVDRRTVYLLGESKGELWYNSGSSSVFERFEWLDSGIVGDTLRRFDNSAVWVQRTQEGELEVVRAGDGYQPQIISTEQLSRQFHLLNTVEDAFAYTYHIDGHNFYVLTFPTGNATWAYDASSRQWNQRSGPFSSNEPIREQVNDVVFCDSWGGHIALDSQASGKLLALQESVYTWDSTAMERRLTGPGIEADNKPKLRFASVQIDIEAGTAQAGDTGDDRVIYLSYSKDGGQTFTSGVTMDIGTGGAGASYHTRLIKRKLGWGRNWIFSLYTASTRKIIIKNAFGMIYGESISKLK